MISRFLDLLIQATNLVSDIYFQLPVAGLEDPIYRERVYTYELYHQLRTVMSRQRDFNDYALNGEIDKRGHPVIRPCAPDFVLHVPGGMGANLAVVEVKAANSNQAGIEKDVDTLEYFLSAEVGYRCGIQLIYGGDGQDIQKFIDTYQHASNGIVLLWHPRPGVPAARLN